MIVEYIKDRFGWRIALPAAVFVGILGLFPTVVFPIWQAEAEAERLRLEAEHLEAVRQQAEILRQQTETLRTMADTLEAERVERERQVQRELEQQLKANDPDRNITPRESVDIFDIAVASDDVRSRSTDQIGSDVPATIGRSFTLIGNQVFSLCGYDGFSASASGGIATLRNPNRNIPSEEPVPLRGWSKQITTAEFAELFPGCLISVTPAETQGTRYLMVSEEMLTQDG